MTDHYQKVTLIGQPCHLLKLTKLPLPFKIADFGVENTVWSMTHIHFSAVMRGQPPFHLSDIAKQNPDIILAVTAGNVKGPHYRFLLNDKTHVPIEMTFSTLGKLQNHYAWADDLSLSKARNLIRSKKEMPKPIPLSQRKIRKKYTPIVQTYDLDNKINEVINKELNEWIK